MNSLVRRALDRLLPPTGTRRANSEHRAATDESTMVLPRVADPGPLVRQFYVAFEEGRR